MSEEEINKMCSDIYEGEDWQPMKDYIKSLQIKLQQKENKEKEIREYITKQVHRNQQFYEMDIDNILEILDKEVN